MTKEEQDAVFDRFHSEGRTDKPDIDIDGLHSGMSEKEREKVREHSSLVRGIEGVVLAVYENKDEKEKKKIIEELIQFLKIKIAKLRKNVAELLKNGDIENISHLEGEIKLLEISYDNSLVSLSEVDPDNKSTLSAISKRRIELQQTPPTPIKLTSQEEKQPLSTKLKNIMKVSGLDLEIKKDLEEEFNFESDMEEKVKKEQGKVRTNTK